MSDTYTHGHHESVLRSHRWRTAENSAGYLLPHLQPGMRLLDVGCGPGTVTIDLAARVAPGEVIGIDRSEDVLEVARTEAADRGAEVNVRFALGDAYDLRAQGLDLADDSIDVVHAHQVLQHLTDPVAALREFRRVMSPEGLVAVRDSDYEAGALAPADPMLARWLELYGEVTRANDADANAGRHLLGWAQQAGFADVTFTTSTWTFAEPETRSWWGELWAERCLVSTFAEQALEYGLSDRAELEAIASAWRRWSQKDDGCAIIVLGEIIARS